MCVDPVDPARSDVRQGDRIGQGECSRRKLGCLNGVGLEATSRRLLSLFSVVMSTVKFAAVTRPPTTVTDPVTSLVRPVAVSDSRPPATFSTTR